MTDRAVLGVLAPGRMLGRVPGVGWILLLLAAAFAAISPQFFGIDNLRNVAIQSSMLLMVAMPMTLVVMTRGIDLSVGSIVSLAGVVLALVTLHSGSLVTGVACAILAGAVVGAVNGLLVAGCSLPPFVVTLSTLGIVQGVNLLLVEGEVTNGLPPALRWVYDGVVAGLPVPVLLAALAFVAFKFALEQTRFGGHVVALGGNREALQLGGIGVKRRLFAVYVVCGVFSAISGLILAARIDGGQAGAGASMEFDAIAAVVLGGTSFERGKGSLGGTALGVLAVGLLKNGLNLASVGSAMQVSAIGLFVIIAVLAGHLGART